MVMELQVDLTEKRILITGADGFIGSHLVEKLVEQDIAVTAFVYYNSFNRWGWLDSLPQSVKDKIRVCAGDIRDFHAVRSAMHDCQIVVHLAALIAIPYSYSAPESYVDTNIKGTLNVLQAARELPIEKIIHTSTSEVYGTAQSVPILEEHPLQAQSPYAASKIAADQLALSFYHSFNLPVCIARPFNTYGPRQSARAVIPTIISQLSNGGCEVKLGASHPTRDFNYISDTINGFIALAESDSATGEVINLGSNFEISIADTVHLIADVMGKKAEIICDQQRLRPENSEVERLFASNKKAKHILGWDPDFSGTEGMRKGLQQTVEWFSQPDNLALYKSDSYNI